MSELLDSILKQIRACEANPGSLLPATSGNIGTYVTCDGEWDIFLFENPGVQTSAPQEIVNGLWIFSNEISIEGEPNQFTALRTIRQNRLQFSGFIADLIEKLETMDFAEALELTLAEWRSRWRLRANDMSFIQRVGLFGELVALRDFINCGERRDASCWVARDSGDGLHDFVIDNQRFEVKTSTTPIADIHIFDEEQMHHRDGLFLLLVKTDISAAGESIDDVAIEIAESIGSHNAIENFQKKLDKAGFSFNKYLEDRFIVRTKHYWESNASQTPFIQHSDIERGLRPVTNINYQILESEIDFNEIDDFSDLLT